MNVTMVSDLLAQPLSGVGRYAYELAAQLRQQLPASALSFVSYRGAETWTQIERRLAVDSSNETNSLRAWARLRLRIASTRLGSFGYSELSQMQYARLDSSMPNAVLHLPTLQEIPRRRRAPIVVTVHDLQGREIATLLDGIAASGTTRLRWDGRASGGSVMPAGIYLVRAQIGAAVLSRRLVRVQ